MRNGNFSVKHVWNYYDQNLIPISTEARGSGKRRKNNLFKFFFNKQNVFSGFRTTRVMFRTKKPVNM